MGNAWDRDGGEERSSSCGGMLLAVLFVALASFILYTGVMEFVFRGPDDPTRHDSRILDDAEEGDAHAQYLMGVFRLTGRQGIERDPVEARRWFEMSAAQDYPPGQYELGELYRYGNGVEKDPEKAAELFRVAMEGGSQAARNALGDLHLRGEGVEGSEEKALALYRVAAEAGYAPAQRNMGYMAAEGRGRPQDYAAAMEWYRKAAEQSDAIAMSNLGIMYEHGQGVEVDLLRAWDCYFTAGLWDYKGAKEHRDRVEGKLPPEWRSQGLYDRELRDCLGGESTHLSRPRSRVRP